MKMGNWVEHDGCGCPVPRGTMVQVRCRYGQVFGPFPALTQSVNGYGTVINVGVSSGSSWKWKVTHTNHSENDIIAYRICNDDSKEAETREARIASFRKLADINPMDVRKVPAKKRVGAQ